MFSLPDRTWLWIAAAFYLGGLILGTIALLRERRHSRTIMYALIATGFSVQTYGLYLRGMAVHGCPLGNQFEFFQFTAWSATSLFLVVGPTFRVSFLGYFTSCMSAALTIVSLAIPAWDATRRVNAFQGAAWIELHAALALFSYGVFGLLALTCIMYLLQLYSLQRQQLRGLFSFLPPILDLDHINLRLLTTGVALMTASVAVGSAYWFRDLASVNVTKVVITLAVWLAYALALALRLRSTLITKRFAWACVGLFVAALISLGPVNSSRKTLAPAEAAHAR